MIKRNTYSEDPFWILCQNCAKGVEEKLAAVPGVFEAKVSIEEHTATISVESAQTDREALVAAVEAAGNKVAP